MRTDKERLTDILIYIEKLQIAFNKNQFFNDEVYRFGLVKYLEIIGEASRALQQKTRDQAKDINWKSIIGFRNIAVHVYNEIDWDSVLDIIENHLNTLKEKILELNDQ